MSEEIIRLSDKTPLPTGAASEATLLLVSNHTDDTATNTAQIEVSVANIDTKTPSPGQATMTMSVPVVIASDQTAIPISDNGGSLTIDATSLPLPTGAATEATLSSLNGKVTAVNTGAVVVSSSALPTGASTSADQVSTNSKLDTVITNTNILNLLKFDASGSLAVSQKTILGNYVQDKTNLPLLLDRQGTGTQTYSNGVVSMSVTSGQYAVCQSYARHPYFAGKSHKIDITFDNFQNQANVVKRAGYFSSTTTAPYNSTRDGVYFEADGANYNFVIANNGTLTTIARSSWNGDKLDGTGASSLTMDFSKFTILSFDFLYLGGSAVRFYFQIGTRLILAHTHQHSNSSTGTIFLSPNKPVRWEIHSSTGTGSIGQICASVSTEGSTDLVTTPQAVNGGINIVNANTIGTTYLLKAVRLQTGFTNAILSDIVASVNANTADEYLLSIRINPTIASSGTLVWTNLTNSYLQHATADTAGNPSVHTVTGGYVAYEDYGVGVAGGSIAKLDKETNVKLGTSINGTADILALCITVITANIDAKGALNLKEA